MYFTQFWDSRPPPAAIEKLMASYRRLNPGLRHRCFDAESADHYIGAHLGSRHQRAYRMCAVPAMQADYFRYCAVWAEGGFYSDADFECVAPVEALLPEDADALLVQRENGVVINNFFAFRNCRHDFLDAVIEVATRALEQRIHGDDVWLTTGPGIFTWIRYLCTSTDEERESYGLDTDLNDDRARALRLCRDVLLRKMGSLNGVFDGFRICPIDDLYKLTRDVALPYKQTARHWTNWPGSIYVDDPHAT